MTESVYVILLSEMHLVLLTHLNVPLILNTSP